MTLNATVLGAGTWGTTFAKVLADAGNDVTLWARRSELAQQINLEHQNGDYLPGIALPDSLRATDDAAAALRAADLVAFAIPSQRLRANLADWVPWLPAGATLVSLMKGVELGTTKRMSEVIAEVAGAGPERIAVVSGPNLAREIAEEQPTATVVACVDEQCAVAVQTACTAAYFRPYTNTDVIGCELGGAIKNVIALACGIAQGMGFGDNTLASIITRGLAETARLGVKLGADPMTFAGLAGLGDLVATCWLRRALQFLWRPAPRRCRATAASANGWDGASRWSRRRTRPAARSRRASSRAARCSTWPSDTVSTRRSRTPSRRCASAA